MTKDQVALDFYFNFNQYSISEFDLLKIILQSDINIDSKIKIIESKFSEILELKYNSLRSYSTHKIDFNSRINLLTDSLYHIQIVQLTSKDINKLYDFIKEQFEKIKHKLSIYSSSKILSYFCYILDYCLGNNIDFKFKKEILSLTFKSLKKYYSDNNEISIDYLGSIFRFSFHSYPNVNNLLFSNRKFIDYFLKLKKYKYTVSFNLFKDFLSEEDKLIIFDKYKNDIFKFDFYPKSKLEFYESQVIKTIVENVDYYNFNKLKSYQRSFSHIYPSWIKICIEKELTKLQEDENNIKDILE